MQAAIGYLKVSTREQGRNGLGLAAHARRSKSLERAKGSSSNPGTRMCRLARERMRYDCARGLQER
jgi:hypothetical protein